MDHFSSENSINMLHCHVVNKLMFRLICKSYIYICIYNIFCVGSYGEFGSNVDLITLNKTRNMFLTFFSDRQR